MNSDTLSLSEIGSLGTRTASFDTIAQNYGNHAAYLAMIQQKDVKIPDGFVITNEAYKKFVNNGRVIPDDVWDSIFGKLGELEKRVGRNFGQKRPLVLEVVGPSKGLAIGGVGLNDFTANMIAEEAGSREVPFTVYPRLIENLGSIVAGIDRDEFSVLFDQILATNKSKFVAGFKAYDWINLTKIFKAIYIKNSARMFPQDVKNQLRMCIEYMFMSFVPGVGEESNFVICIKQFLFGNFDIDSYSAIVCSHNLINGKEEDFGTFAADASIDDLEHKYRASGPVEKVDMAFQSTDMKVADIMKRVREVFLYPTVVNIVAQSNSVYVTSIDMFTAGDSIPFKIVSEAVKSGKPNVKAIQMLPLSSAINLGGQQLTAVPKEPAGRGSPGSFGVAIGCVAFSNKDCIEQVAKGKKVILAKSVITYGDYEAVNAASGVICIHGSDYSQGALLARELGRPGVFGCSDARIDKKQKLIIIEDGEIHEGEEVTIAGDCFYTGALPLTHKAIPDPIIEVLSIADQMRTQKIKVYSRANNPKQAKNSIMLGADGIGFISMEKLLDQSNESMLRFIKNPEDQVVIKELELHIVRSLTEILSSSGDAEVTIRLFNQNLTHFLPSLKELTKEVARLRTLQEYKKGFNQEDELKQKVSLLDEIRDKTEGNPLMATRGIRLLLVCKSFLTLQINAISSSIKAVRMKGSNITLRILLPAVSEANEVVQACETIRPILKQNDIEADIGSSLEVTRACLTADKIAEVSDFIAFDIPTFQQIFFGMSKEDTEHSFIMDYIKWGIIEKSPFTSLDEIGTGDILKKCISLSNKPVEVITSFVDEKTIRFLAKVGISGIYSSPKHVTFIKLCVGME